MPERQRQCCHRPGERWGAVQQPWAVGAISGCEGTEHYVYCRSGQGLSDVAEGWGRLLQAGQMCSSPHPPQPAVMACGLSSKCLFCDTEKKPMSNVKGRFIGGKVYIIMLQSWRDALWKETESQTLAQSTSRSPIVIPKSPCDAMAFSRTSWQKKIGFLTTSSTFMMLLQVKIQKKITSLRTKSCRLQNTGIFSKIQGSQFFLCETDKSWTKVLQQAVPGLLRNCSWDSDQQNCCAEQDADLTSSTAEAASYLWLVNTLPPWFVSPRVLLR